MFDITELIGKEETLARIQRAVDALDVYKRQVADECSFTFLNSF